MLPGPGHPERGRFVRDQVAALRRLDGVEVELHEFPPGPRALLAAGRELRSRYGHAARLDVVHAHFGLTAWPALAVPARVRALTMHGTDLADPRTRLATRAVLSRIDLPAAVSAELLAHIPGPARRRARVLPCGVDLERFAPMPRDQARAELDLPVTRPFLLFPADPARAEKRHDRALEVASRAGVELIALGSTDPERMPLWINAANAVLVPSEREGFGLAVLESLACDVPVLATAVGVHREALHDLEGTLCAPFEADAWARAAEAHLRSADPRVAGRERAARFSASAMAERVLEAWRELLDGSR
jgi:teichuronic acid biosynthesis glycosyltransferase TuaC